MVLGSRFDLVNIKPKSLIKDNKHWQDVKEREPLCTAGMANWCSYYTMENSMAKPQKIKCRNTI